MCTASGRHQKKDTSTQSTGPGLLPGRPCLGLGGLKHRDFWRPGADRAGSFGRLWCCRRPRHPALAAASPPPLPLCSRVLFLPECPRPVSHFQGHQSLDLGPTLIPDEVVWRSQLHHVCKDPFPNKVTATGSRVRRWTYLLGATSSQARIAARPALSAKSLEGTPLRAGELGEPPTR